KAEAGKTFFQVFQGARTMSDAQQKVRFPAAFTDGTSNTILIAEAAEAVHWASPKDIEFSPKVSPKKQVGNHYGKGTLASMADGSVRTIPPTVTEKTLRLAITPDDGEVLGPDWDGDDDEDFGGRKDKVKDRFRDKEKRDPRDRPVPP